MFRNARFAVLFWTSICEYYIGFISIWIPDCMNSYGFLFVNYRPSSTIEETEVDMDDPPEEINVDDVQPVNIDANGSNDGREVWPCPVCKHGLSRKSSLLRHFIRHHKK